MPNIKSAKKRVRQNEKRRLHNKSIKSAMKTQIKKFLHYIEKEDVDNAKVELAKAMSDLDKIGRKRIWHPNNTARKKAKLHQKFQQLLQKNKAEA